MLCSSVFGLLLACTVSFSSATNILENGMPIKWGEAQVSQLPIVENVLNPDPWNYLHRMSLYKSLMAVTDKLMLYLGEGETQSPLWGLSLQLGWMQVSDRLADPTDATTCGKATGDSMCISTNSWWAIQNYMVSVLPFLSAANQSFFEGIEKVQMVSEGVTGFCTTYDECTASFPDAMAKWDIFFKNLINIGASALSDAEKKDATLHNFWEAQMASLVAPAAEIDNPFSVSRHYSAEEVSFMKSWLNSANYVAAAHFQSSLEKAAKFISPLPSRVLKEGDVAPNIEGLSPEENNTLHVFSWMDTLNKGVDGALVQTWKNAMCSVETREKGSLLLEQALTSPAYTSITFMSVLASMTMSCEWS